MVILDTSVIIDHLRQQGKESVLDRLVKNSGDDLAISILTVQELYEGKSTIDSEKEQLMLATITPLKILSYTYEIAELAGRLARDLSQPIEFADAAIAATVIINGGSFLTLNKKDFLRIANLELLEL